MEAPKEYKDAGLANLVGGILNIMTAGVWLISLIWVCIGLMWVVPMAMGAWQAWVGYKIYNGEIEPNAKTASIVGLVAGIFNINPLAVFAGIFGMMNVDKPEVKAFLQG